MKEIIIKGDKYIGKTLMEALTEEGVQLAGTCGGMGTCGKCRAKVNGQEVLACKHRITGDGTVQVEDNWEDMGVKERTLRLPEGFVCDQAEPDTYGVALDLGTTTVVVMLWDLYRSSLADMEAVSNPQRFYGGDVMARISFAMRAPWNLKRLQSSLVNEVNQVISRLTMKQGIKLGQIRKIAAVGNTTMSHLFLGEDISGLAGHPFEPSFRGAVVTTARDLGLAAHEEAEVYIGPNMAGHVGSDITAGVLASGYLEKGGSRLLLDIGTNGEIFLIAGDRSFCCSAAAGPAFEGSALHQGMRAAEGAICRVDYTEGRLVSRIIGGGPAKGICGSGIIDALAAMLDAEVMDRFGTIRESCVLWAGDENEEAGEGDYGSAVAVTQQDIREVQMAKAAIAAGVKVLMKEAGLEMSQLEEIGIAGAFGNAIRMKSAVRIGLLPEAEMEKLQSLGNAAGLGASMLLLSGKCREKAEKIAASVEHVELASSPDFQSRYIEEMNF